MPESSKKLYFDGRINVGTLFYVIGILIILTVGYVDLKNSISLIKDDQDYYKSFQDKIELEYVTQEYLEIVVIERIDRLDAALERRLIELEKKLQDQLNRIEEKIDDSP